MDLLELHEATLKWSTDRGIIENGNVQTQTLKLMSEVGELADNVAKKKDIRDDIGDCVVVLTNIAALAGTTLEECWALAYKDIKDRKGFLNANGTFVKSTNVRITAIRTKEMDLALFGTHIVLEVDCTDGIARLYYLYFTNTNDMRELDRFVGKDIELFESFAKEHSHA